jgi:hypothetical protein
MNKNHIEGRRDGTSWHDTPKSKGSVVEGNVAVVQGAEAAGGDSLPIGSSQGGRSPATNAFLPGEIPRRKWHGKSAEVVVAENKPGVRDPHKLETGNLETVKDRTDKEPITAWRTLTPIKPVGQEVGECRHDGKHVGFGGEVAWAERSKLPLPGRRKLQP